LKKNEEVDSEELMDETNELSSLMREGPLIEV
jgi:hypothetical protein